MSPKNAFLGSRTLFFILFFPGFLLRKGAEDMLSYGSCGRMGESKWFDIVNP